MARLALPLQVTAKDRAELRQLLKGGVQQVRVVLRALALLQLDSGASPPQVAKAVPLTPQAIRRIGLATWTGAWSVLCTRRSDRAPPTLLEDSERQRIIAMVQ